jgi:hypothetical protein
MKIPLFVVRVVVVSAFTDADILRESPLWSCPV